MASFITFTNVQSSWLAFVRRFYWPLFDPRYPYPSLVLKGYELCTGNRAGGQRPKAFFPGDLYTFVYVWLCGQEMKTAFYCHIHFLLLQQVLCFSSLLLDTLRFISSSAGARQSRGGGGLTVRKKKKPSGMATGHGFWGGVYFARSTVLLNISKDLPAYRVIPPLSKRF